MGHELNRRRFLQWSAGTSLAAYAVMAEAQQPTGAEPRCVWE